MSCCIARMLVSCLLVHACTGLLWPSACAAHKKQMPHRSVCTSLNVRYGYDGCGPHNSVFYFSAAAMQTRFCKIKHAGCACNASWHYIVTICRISSCQGAAAACPVSLYFQCCSNASQVQPYKIEGLRFSINNGFST